MRRFMTGGGVSVLCVLVLVCVAAPGCFCFSQPPRDAIIMEQPTFEKEAAPPPPKPVVRPRVEEPPPPVVTPPPPPPAKVPPSVVQQIEDLGQKYPGLFIFDKERGMFRFSADITFDSGSNVVKPQAKAALVKLAEILNGDLAKDRMLTIIGYTDADRVAKADTVARLKALGKPANNMGLSEARAESVAAVLKAGGIEAGRITTQGKGEANPIADNRSPAGKAQNRRVEIYLTPMGGTSAPAGRALLPTGR